MPIYEYRCNNCGQFEIVQKITERALKRCPTCQSKVTKLISNTSFHLKGSGWYVTDYARAGGASAKESSKSESTASESSSESKSESKSDTETKTDSKPKASGSDKKGKQAAAA